MTMDSVFVTATIVMAAVALACRLSGLLIGIRIGEGARMRRFLDILPACAMGAVVGPFLASASMWETASLIVGAGVFLLSARFMLSLWAGTAVLLGSYWFPGL